MSSSEARRARAEAEKRWLQAKPAAGAVLQANAAKLEVWYEPRALCNLTIVSKADGTRIHVHRDCLAVQSGVIAALVEMGVGAKDALELALDEEAQVLQQHLLDHVYPSKHYQALDFTGVRISLELARKYDVSNLTGKCEDYLCLAIAECNTASRDVVALLEWLAVACEYQLPRLQIKVINKLGGMVRDSIRSAGDPGPISAAAGPASLFGRQVFNFNYSSAVAAVKGVHVPGELLVQLLHQMVTGSTHRPVVDSATGSRAQC